MSDRRIAALRDIVARPTTVPNEREAARRALESIAGSPARESECKPDPRALCWRGFTAKGERVLIEMPSRDRALEALGEPAIIFWCHAYWCIEKPRGYICDRSRGIPIHYVWTPIKKMTPTTRPIALPAPGST